MAQLVIYHPKKTEKKTVVRIAYPEAEFFSCPHSNTPIDCSHCRARPETVCYSVAAFKATVFYLRRTKEQMMPQNKSQARAARRAVFGRGWMPDGFRMFIAFLHP
jgi:hypothetical protein